MSTSSWWVGLTRDAFDAQAAARRDEMSHSRFANSGDTLTDGPTARRIYVPKTEFAPPPEWKPGKPTPGGDW